MDAHNPGALVARPVFSPKRLSLPLPYPLFFFDRHYIAEADVIFAVAVAVV